MVDRSGMAHRHMDKGYFLQKNSAKTQLTSIKDDNFFTIQEFQIKKPEREEKTFSYFLREIKP